MLKWKGMTERAHLLEDGIPWAAKDEKLLDTQGGLRRAFPAEEPQSSLSTDNSTTQGIWEILPQHHFSLTSLWTNVVKYRKIQE